MSCQMVPPHATFRICIPRQIARTGLCEARIRFIRLFPEKERGDVLSPAEEETVAEVCVLTDHPVAAHEWKDERQPLGVTDGLDVRICDKLAVLRETAHNDTDLRFHNYFLPLVQ